MSKPTESKSASKRRKTGSTGRDSGDVITDPRFSHIQSDPRYRLPSKKHTHVKVDKRFAHMLRDEEFSKNAPVDRYGRKLRKDDTKKQLERFYTFEDDEGKDAEGSEEEEVDDEDALSVDDDKAVQRELRRADRGDYDPARDGGFSSSSSEEESSSDEESDDEAEAAEDNNEADLADQRGQGVPMGEVSSRIAVVNLDWDNIRAEDLMAVFSSFLPTGGKISNVSIYPSEFGRERIEREEMEGPPKELFATKEDSDEGSDTGSEDEEEEEEKIKQSILAEDDGADFDSAKLRNYQLERLRYYYAILTISSENVAKHIYDAVDGAEYLSSANFFDLRFVPDDTDFADDVPRDECKRLPGGYKPNEFVTDALQHSKVKLTWDTDDKARKDAQARAFKGSRKELDENDLKAYLGSDSSDDEDEDEDEDEDMEPADAADKGGMSTKLSKKETERARIRALLGLGSEPQAKTKDSKPVGDMEVTFSAGLSAAPTRDNVFENEPEKDETTREKYIRKERERKKRRKAKREDGETGDNVDGVQEEKEEAKPAEGNSEVDLGFDDPFFTAPEHDAANTAKRRKEERIKQREQRKADEEATATKRAELELLMMDDDKKAPIKHFDMNEITKAEKRAKKPAKYRKAKKGEADAEVVDDFKMDVQDPRFQGLFESHEFAIDPTNPRFKQTKGMNALLEEGRKRRRGGDDEDLETVKSGNKKKRSATDKAAEGDDISKLVERVKGKAKKR